MAKKRYTLYFTDMTHAIVNELETRGHKVREILNAGVILYDQADIRHRGEAVAIAHSMIKEDLLDIISRLRSTLDWMDQLKHPEAFTPQERQLADHLRSMLLAFEDDAASVESQEGSTDKPRRRTAKSG